MIISMKITDIINERIEQIINKVERPIIILKGISTDYFDENNRYFSLSFNYLDKFDINLHRNTVIQDVFSNLDFTNRFKWMTMEEFQIFKEYLNINSRPLVILENNLFYKQFPYENTLSDVTDIYKHLYNNDELLNDDQNVLLAKVSNFYGKIDYSIYSNNFYMTFPENFENVIQNNTFVYKLFNYELQTPEIVENIENKDVIQIELSDDEIPFLDLETELINNNSVLSYPIYFKISSDFTKLPHNYLERISILKVLYNIEFKFIYSSIKRQYIRNEKKYLDILNRYYGYSDYRELTFYKNIESKSKETVGISQAQIIDDIVSQTQNALSNNSFRDIYITASTGSGKSVMFQIPTLYFFENCTEDVPLTLVISPLIGLMNDQVMNMKQKGISIAETINGNTSPYEKENILKKIINGEVHMLYLSPETLLSKSDIKLLIGDRRIGTLIVDEAHIVTTWGKSFRADYWYLGLYLSKIRKEQKFPIVTFTATAIYGGSEDMYVDTRNSLNLINPISYFGVVRRNDILMKVRSSDKEFNDAGKDYRKTKDFLALKHLNSAFKKNQKSLVYFPTISLLNKFYQFVLKNSPEISSKVGKYYGSLSKEDKNAVLERFKTGDLQFVLATKAFGMGIDIPDITNVYHYAPTGNVVDYIQEIGRVARDKNKVEFGFGIIDFLKSDISDVKKLYGLSSIKKNELVEVIRKIVHTYNDKQHNRRLLVSPEDFKYIFSNTALDEESLDNKVKTALLMIEKDFASPKKLGYSPFSARPRTYFGNDLLLVDKSTETFFLKSRLREFFHKKYNINSQLYSSVYEVELSGIWEKYYKHLSYPEFKYLIFSHDHKKKLEDNNIFDQFILTTGIEVKTNCKLTIEDILSKYRLVLGCFNNFINDNLLTESQFNIIQLSKYFQKELKIMDPQTATSLSDVILNSAFEFSKVTNCKFITERSNSSIYNQRYQVHQDATIYNEFIMKNLNDILTTKSNTFIDDNTILTFFLRNNSSKIDTYLTVLGIGNVLELLNYQLIGGNNPLIDIKIYRIFHLESAIKPGANYKNLILEDVQHKHYTSVAMLKYLFTKQFTGSSKDKIINYTNWFWDTIEDYFMGVLPEEVERNLQRNNK